MSSKIIKAVSVLAVILLGTSLMSACGKSSDSTEEEDKYIYTSSFQDIDLGIENGYISASIIEDEKLYAITVEYDPETYENNSTVLHIVDLNTFEDTTMNIDCSENSYFSNLHVKEDGSIITIANEYDPQSYAEFYYIRNYGSDGKITSDTDITPEIGEGIYIQKVIFAKDQSIYVQTSNGVMVFSEDGKVLSNIKTDSWINRMYSDAEGKIYVQMYNEADWSIVVKEVDAANSQFGAEVSGLPSDGDIVNGINGNYIVLGSDGAYEYNPSTEEKNTLWNWVDVDITHYQADSFFAKKDGTYMIAQQSWDEGSGSRFEIATLSKILKSECKQEVITLGCMYLDWQLREHIIKFNKTNPNYRISVKTYNDYDDYEAAREKYRMDLASGKTFDIVDLSDNTNEYAGYVKKGALEDLKDYFDKEYNMSDYFENAVLAYEVDGKLGAITPYVTVRTLAIPKKYADGISTWNLDELINLRKQHMDIDFLEYANKSSALNYMLMFSMDSFVDWEKGTCDFAGEDFKKILEFAATFSDEVDENYDDWESIQSGKTIMVPLYLSQVEEFEIYKQLFGEDIELVGYPTKNGGEHSLYSQVLLGIAGKSKHKEGAWEFLKTLLGEDFQKSISYNGFPVLKSAFHDNMEEEMKIETYIDENGVEQMVSHGGWGNGDIMIEYYGATQDTVDKITKAYEDAKRASDYDDKVIEIITEEVQPFFEGQKSVEDVTGIIQNRVKIYLAESK